MQMDRSFCGQSASHQLRIGLLLDSLIVSKSVYELCEWSRQQNSVCISHQILFYPRNQCEGRLQKTRRMLRQNGIQYAISQAFFSSIVALEKMLLRRIARYKNHLRSFDLSELIPNRTTIHPTATSRDDICIFDDEEVCKVKDLNLDLLINFSRSILKGNIVSAARLGIISLHFGANHINRSGPPGFWEVYLRQDTTAFIIERRTSELAYGEVLFEGCVGTKSFYLLNQAAIYEKSFYYLKSVLIEIATTGQIRRSIHAFPSINGRYPVPRLKESTIYLFLLLSRLGHRLVRNILGIDYRWNVAFVYSNWTEPAFSGAIKLRNPPNHFLADPFVITRNGGDYCFVEDYDYGSRRGCIAVYEIEKESGMRIGVALEEDFHLSFPFLFEFEGTLYMCPESSGNRDIRLYKCVEFPLRWELETVLMKNLSAVDSMLLEKNGKWWLITSIDPTNNEEHNAELSIYSADFPLSTEWKSHKRNPIFMDATRGRNGGLLRDGARIFRVAQGQGFDMYGKTTSINEMLEINDHDYVETPVLKGAPNSPGAVSGHHLHSNGKITVFDFTTSSSIRS
jgi:hypothetical protein